MGVSAGLYGASVFLRVARQLHTNDFLLLARAEVSALPDGVTKLVVPTAARWSAGQHVFVRLPGYGQGFGMVQSHPFTIISLPNANPHKTVSNVVLMARARGGLTKALYDHALAAQGGVPLSSWSPDLNDSDEKAQAQNLSALSMPAILDGPYGASASVAGYDEALFMAGGSGATFVVASLMDLVWQWRNGTASTKRADFVWAVREAGKSLREEGEMYPTQHIRLAHHHSPCSSSVRTTDSIDWLREQLEAAWTLAPPGHLSITLHITSSRAPALDSDPSTSPSASASSSPSPESSGADTTLRHRAPPTTTKTLPTGPSNSNSSSNLNLPKGWAVHSGPHVRPAVKELLRSFAQRAANEPASISTSSTSATARRPAPPSHGDSFTSDPEKDGAGGASTPPNAPSGLAYQPDSLSSPSANPATSARPALAILVCGPIGMASDASNAASDLQMDILRGRLNLAEVWLCNEAFGW